MTIGTRKSPAEARTSINAVLSATGRPRFSLSSRRRESISSHNWMTQCIQVWVEIFTQFTAAREHFVPQLDALRLSQIQVGDGANIALQELAARRQVEAFERISKKLEIGILNWQTRRHGGTGAGHSGWLPNLCLFPAGCGERTNSRSQEEQVAAHSYHGCAA